MLLIGDSHMATVLLSDLESELIFRKQRFQSLQSERYEKKRKEGYKENMRMNDSF